MLGPEQAPEAPKSQVWNLEPCGASVDLNLTYLIYSEHELRIEVEFDATIGLTVTQGKAEIFGTELAESRRYQFTGFNFSVFSWYGCTIKVEGKCHAYVAGETPMVNYLNTHTLIEEKRMNAVSRNTPGPRVIIVGATDTGKSTLSRILVNYAVRLSRRPIFIDLDVGQNQITVPGVIAAVPVEQPIDPELVYSQSIPIAYFFGHQSPGENPKLYRMLLTALAEQCMRRMAQNRIGYELLQHAITTFQVDVVLCLDNERLYNDLSQYFSANRNLKVTKLAKSGGVVTRPAPFRRRTRLNKIREYFYGPTGNDLSPHSTIVDFKDVSIYRIGGQIAAPASALPIGASSTQDPTHLSEVPPSADMVHSIFALSHALSADRLLEANVAGFLYVQKIDFEHQKITFLSPCPGALPGRYVLMSMIKWLE